MPSPENRNTGTSFEQQPGDLLAGYQDALRTQVESYSGSMEAVTREHERDLQLFLEEDVFSQGRFVAQSRLAHILNATSTTVSVGVAAIHVEAGALFEESNLGFTDALAVTDRQYWEGIQQEAEEAKEAEKAQPTGELHLKILGLHERLDHYSDPEARELMKAGFDYHLWETLQIVFRRDGIGHVTKSLLAVASSPEAEASMKAGLDQSVWQAVHRRAIKSGPDAPTFLASLDNASTEKARAAMKAALDYQVWQAVQKRGGTHHRGTGLPGDVESVLALSTPLARQVIEQELNPEQRKEHGRDPGGGFFGDFRDDRFSDPFGRAHEEAYGRKAGSQDGSANGSQERQSQNDPNSHTSQEPPRSEQHPQPDLTSIDPYAVLGISRDASQEEIKKVYRKLAREHHTDTGGEDLEAIKVINNAHDIVSDPGARAYYDKYGHLRGYKKQA